MLNKLVVDGDVILYQSLARDPDDPLSVSQENFRKLVESIRGYTFSDEVFIYVGGKNNFRKSYDFYKANRQMREPHPHLHPMKQWVVEAGLATPGNGAEADDYVLCKAEELRQQGLPYVIASIDKDLKTYPGVHFNTLTRLAEIVSDSEAELNLLSQLLSGDRADNIRGLWMVGEITAKKYLRQFKPEDRRAAVANRWKQDWPEDWHERLQTVYNLIYIRRRHEDCKFLELPKEFTPRDLGMDDKIKHFYTIDLSHVKDPKHKTKEVGRFNINLPAQRALAWLTDRVDIKYVKKLMENDLEMIYYKRYDHGFNSMTVDEFTQRLARFNKGFIEND